MIKRRRTRGRLRDARNLLIALPLLSAFSILATVWAAIVRHTRLNWLFIISLAFLLLTGIFFKHIRRVFKTLPSYRARRRRAETPPAARKKEEP